MCPELLSDICPSIWKGMLDNRFKDEEAGSKRYVVLQTDVNDTKNRIYEQQSLFREYGNKKVN